MAYDYKRYFDEIALIRDLTNMPEDVKWQTAAPAQDGEHHRIVLYLGCNVFRTSHMIQTIIAIFDRLGLDYVAVGGPTYCCGIVHHQQGDTAAAGGMADHTIKLFERYEPEEVVMWCPSCIYFYDEVRQARLPFKVSHAAEFLVSKLPEIRFIARVNVTVALHYHSASQPRRSEGLAGQRLLEAVPGLRFAGIEPDPRFGRSCTPSVQQQVGPETWNQMAREEIRRARAVGADTLATIYHGCQRYLCVFEPEGPIAPESLFAPESPFAIEHYLSVFGRGLGIEFEDKFKKYRLWQDPERVLVDTTPCQRANNVEAARARAVVLEAFGSLPSARDVADSPPS